MPTHDHAGALLTPPRDALVRSTKSAAVVAHDLERRFGSFVAVNKVSFEVARGEIFGFLGPNGAGKSTTIRMLSGILAPTGGSGTVAGFDIRTETEKIKARIGYMSQKFSLYEDLTVEENIDFYSGIYQVPARLKAERKAWVLQMAGLTEHRRSRTGQLSAGWKQRLALGCAVVHEPEIVFLDEPTSGVDPISRRQFWDLIYDLTAKGVTVFVTTHYLDEAEHCHRLALMHAGRLAALGTVSELKRIFRGRAIVEVRTPAPMAALRALESLPIVEKSSPFGTALHVWLKPGVLDTAPLRERLDAAGLAADAFEFVQPSLEDVFMDVVEREERAAV